MLEATTPKKRGRTKKVETPRPYKVTLDVLGTKHVGVYENVSEGIIRLQPQVLKGKVALKVEKGGKEFNRVLVIPLARKLFNNEIARNIFSKHIERSLP